MNIKELQTWLNDHGATPKLKVDGIAGTLTRVAIIQVFVNKNAKAINEEQLLQLSKELGDTSTKRMKAVATVESGGSGWFTSGLPKILYERHYFYKLTSDSIRKLSGWFINKVAGGYSTDANNNGINDSWEKLAEAACRDPDAAFKSVSIGKFQVMGSHYKMLGFSHPIEMLWAATQSEYEHYKMLVGYIKGTNLTKAYLALGTDPEKCRLFAAGYNGPAYTKYNYHLKLAKAMR